MLDIKFIRENLDLCKEAAKNKNRKVDFDKILILDGERKKLIGQIDEKRAERNKSSKNKEQITDNKELRELGKKLKEEIKKLEEELRTVEKGFFELMLTVPNVPDKSVPVGKDSSG